MNDHPVNLGVRFLLEIVAVVVLSMWGWKMGGAARYVLAIGTPLVAMAVWAVFRVPGDPGNAPVAVSGLVRLLIEALIFGGAIAALFAMEYKPYAWTLLVVVVVHYAVSYDRVIRFLQH